jgi:ATP-dependent RNA helicase DeaD
MPHDWASIAQFLGPLLDRVDVGSPEIQLLVITSDADVAGAVSASAVKLLDGRSLQVLAATSSARATRLARIRAPQVLAGTATTILEMLRAASIKVDAVRAVCIAWADELVTRDQTSDLESVMAEVPKDAARVIVTAEAVPEVDELVERYARRARRVAAAGEGKPTPIEYVTVSSSSRLATLRRLLDDTDPKSATIFVRDRDSIDEVNDLLRAIGYDAESSVRVGLTAAPGEDLVVLYDLPASREELAEAAGAASRTIALVQPRQLTSLRSLAAGGAVKSRTLPESGVRARDAEERVRAELRAVLGEGKFGRALLNIEPLLDDYDGAEIAAAALLLLEREREAMRAALAAIPATQRGSGEMVRLFITVGSRDGVRPSDLVGALANQGGVSSSELGKVEIRESFSIVEASPAVAETLIEKVTGTSIKGRRAIVRRDETPERGSRPRGEGRGGEGRGGERGERSERGERGDRPGRGAPRGAPRGGPRGERGSDDRRGGRDERRPRAPRRGDRE